MTKRWFPRVRFSLLTLLLAVLCIGSGATLWWNWGTWVVRRMAIDGSESGAVFTSDERFILVNVARDATHSGGVDVFDARNGSLVRRLSMPLQPSAELHETYSIARNDFLRIHQGSDAIIFRISTGERVEMPWPEKNDSPEIKPGATSSPTFLTRTDRPSPISENDVKRLIFSPHGKYAMLAFRIQLLDGQTGQLLWRSTFEAWPWQSGFTEDEQLLIASNGWRLRLIDAATGKVLLEFKSGLPGDLLRAQIARRSGQFITFTSPDAKIFTSENRQEVLLWSPICPRQWYGPAWRPEFWLTLVPAQA